MLDYYSELKFHLYFISYNFHHFYSQAKQLFITCFSIYILFCIYIDIPL